MPTSANTGERPIAPKPAIAPLTTRWAAQVDPNYPLPEYPRPQLVRADWQNLNGLWDYAILPASANAPTHYEGKILVPFAVESALSRVGRPLLPNQTLWYNRTFEVPSSWRGRRVLLHFGAVDWLARVWLNGSFIGEHSGGYLPFSFEITPQLDWNRPNELRVAVMDPTDTERQALGKQTLHPKEIWYTPVSGIWQTVWLEPLAQTALHALRLTPDIDHGLLHLQAVLDGAKDGNFLLEATVMEENRLTAQITVPAGEKFDLQIPAPRLWTPTTPFLYGLRLRLLGHGQVLDEVTSYFAMRKFSIEKDADGFMRFTLNNRPIFLFGPLDQGYFPDGLYTAPTDAALRFDIEYTRKLGCNLIRKHVKIEPARWYYHCDQLGMIVWQDMPNGGKPVGSLRTLLAIGLGRNESDNSHYKRFGRESSGNRADFEAEIQAMLKHLYNTPCIAVWVPFNEGWGQFDSARITKQIKAWDPTRLVDSASGWFDQGAGDFESLHIYGLRLRRRNPQAKTAQRAFVISEFGGYSLALERHLWDAHKKFGYRFYKTSQALTEAYLELLEDQLKPLIRQGLAAAIYTQTTDVETEINGYLTYDRAVEKMPVDRLAAVHRKIINILGK